jgi:hypothetical protein
LNEESLLPLAREEGFLLSELLGQLKTYAFTFFWILITRFVRAVICFFRAFTISET